ncbi:MAG: thiol-disulfide isomerase [Isosphaeraceae bacterium]|jgi:peroxiredoxin/mono/diheme cytochrome c family protein|nr:MAG: thiol-disulfide isomerase [Isosphaeraceae bacterium]
MSACLALILLLAAPEDPPALDRLVGSAVPDFTLTNTLDGKPIGLRDQAGHAATVLVFTGVECPIGDLYLPRLIELHQTYAPRGVAFLALNSNAGDDEPTVAHHARQFGLTFPVLKDHDGAIASRLQVERTCEVILLDAQNRIRYRGAIDDQYGYGTRRRNPVHHYLRDALDAVLDGREPDTTASSVAGCPIDRSATNPARPAPRIRPAADSIVEALRQIEPDIDPDSLGSVTYADHVAPILRQHCQSCHRPGQVGPFPLLTYDDARRHADGIHEVVESRRMPPWHADPRYGQFANDRRLSAHQRATLLAWVEQGAPRGDARREPPPADWPEGWTIGTPDLVFEIPEPFIVPADGVVPYQHFEVPTGFTEDRWIQALEPQPGDRSVVHHIIVYLKPPGTRLREIDALEHLAGYAPGDMPTALPDGIAKRIPAGSSLVFQLHYTPTGKVRRDQSRVGIWFARSEPKYRARTVPVLNSKFTIPAGDPNHEVRATSRPVPRDTPLLGFFPHMHLRGKDFTYTAVYPDGSREILLSVPRYDFAWQSYYWLKEPKILPKGTRLDCVAHFDNSTANPALTEQDASKPVRWGDQTWEEMMIGYVDLLEPIEPPADPAGE